MLKTVKIFPAATLEIVSLIYTTTNVKNKIKTVG